MVEPEEEEFKGGGGDVWEGEFDGFGVGGGGGGECLGEVGDDGAYEGFVDLVGGVFDVDGGCGGGEEAGVFYGVC